MARIRFLLMVTIVALLLSLTTPPATGADVTIMAGNFLAQFYNNTTLSGAPVLTRADPAINFTWSTGSPGPGVNPDVFSARWTGTFPITVPGDYVFILTTDDGARLWVDNNLLIDTWFDQPPTTYTTTVTLAAGTHTIKVEYYENTGIAAIALAWGLAGSAETFSAEYFANATLTGVPVFTRVDATVDFNWGYGSPGPGVPADYFSVRWVAYVHFPMTGNYDFHIQVDDGARLYLDGVPILNHWYAQPLTHHMVRHPVTAGGHEIKMEYFERTEVAAARLWWSPSGVATEVIVDDMDPGFTKGGPFYQAAIGYRNHIFWTRNATTMQENWGRWTPILPNPGEYEVFVFIPRNYATTRNARYTVYHNGVWSTRIVNQYIYYDAWVSLGIHRFHAGGGEFVFLTDMTGEPYLARQIGFDAVKFVYRGP